MPQLWFNPHTGHLLKSWTQWSCGSLPTQNTLWSCIWESYRWNTQSSVSLLPKGCGRNRSSQRKMSVMGMTGLQKCFHRKAGTLHLIEEITWRKRKCISVKSGMAWDHDQGLGLGMTAQVLWGSQWRNCTTVLKLGIMPFVSTAFIWIAEVAATNPLKQMLSRSSKAPGQTADQHRGEGSWCRHPAKAGHTTELKAKLKEAASPWRRGKEPPT